MMNSQVFVCASLLLVLVALNLMILTRVVLRTFKQGQLMQTSAEVIKAKGETKAAARPRSN
jgi:hypothetical protein